MKKKRKLKRLRREIKNKQKCLATTLIAKIVQENNKSRREETIDVNLETSILGNAGEES